VHEVSAYIRKPRLYVKTNTILDKILARKVEEVSEMQKHISLEQMKTYPREFLGKPRDFVSALRRDTVALIAEIKRASPSKGLLIDLDPDQVIELGKTYANNGAAAISVLTDEDFFQGHIHYMRDVRVNVSVPVLRKDFIIDPYQIYHSYVCGADAILLIVMALEDQQIADLHALIIGLGMAALVEVHNEAELERALKIGAKLIGVNNRDLRTFHEDLETTARLAKLVPSDVTLVAESAIRSAADVKRMGELGAHAVLVGEGLVKSEDIGAAVRQFSSQKREG
jgi:indole-3-glycerol phosphate synthase